MEINGKRSIDDPSVPSPDFTFPIDPNNVENKARVKIDLGKLSASPNIKYGAHIAAGWILPNGEPAQSNTYHKVRVTFDSIVMNEPVKKRISPNTQTSPPNNDHFDHQWEHLWVDVNGKWIGNFLYEQSQ